MPDQEASSSEADTQFDGGDSESGVGKRKGKKKKKKKSAARRSSQEDEDEYGSQY